MVTLLNRRGAEFLVNTNTSGSQRMPHIEALAGGGFVIVWSDNSGIGGDNSIAAVKAQLFDANGAKVGSEFLVNTTTAGPQSLPRVTGLPSGRFVVTWTDDSQSGGDTSFSAVRAQLFEANGTKVGDEILVNTAVANAQSGAAITELSSGGFVITWIDASLTGGDSSQSGIKGQLFDASAAKVGGEFLVNASTLAAQTSPSVIGLQSGGFAVSWTDRSGTGGDTNPPSIRLQIFNAAGTKIGGELLVNSVTAASQVSSSITQLEGGRLVVAWVDLSRSTDQSGSGIKAQIFDPSGVKIGPEFLVNTSTDGDQRLPLVKALPDGGFLVIWESVSPEVANAFHLVGQVFNADGVKTGIEFLITDTPVADQLIAGVTLLASGELVVTWTDSSGGLGDASATAIHAQIFTLAASAPTDMALSVATVSETHVENTVAAVFSATGAINSSFTYEIVSDSTGGAFRIEGDRLIVEDNGKLDFETDASAELRVRATDLNGDSYEETLSVAIADAAIEARYSAGDEFMVNVAPALFHTPLSVTALASGNFLVVTTYLDPGASDPDGLRGRIYDAAGNPLGAEITFDLLSRGLGNQAVEALPSGGFVMIYEGPLTVSPGSMDGFAIRAQFFGSTGNEVGGEVVVSTTHSGFLTDPSIASLSSGNLVVTWTAHWNEDPNSGAPFPSQILGQIISPAGVKIGGEFRVNTAIDGQQQFSDVTELPGGGFFVTWMDSPTLGLKGQLFNSVGGKVGEEIQIVSGDFGMNGGTRPEATLLASGNILVSWATDVGESGPFDIAEARGRIFSPLGAPLGEVFTLGLVFGQAAPPRVAAIPSGGFVMTWSEISPATKNPDEPATWARIFDVTGAPVGDAFLVAESGGQGVVAALQSGDLAFAWSHSFIENGSRASDAFGRIVSPAITSIDGTEGDDTLNGTSGLDEINGLGGNDLIGGDAGRDILDGGTGNDRLNGGAGNDELDGASGDDVMAGGIGDDLYFVDSAGDSIIENLNEGFDEVRTGLAGYTLAANVEKLTGTSSSGQLLTGNGLANVISGGTGSDTMAGAGGNDLYFVGAGDVVVENSGGGTDEVRTSLAVYSLTAHVETLTGTSSSGQSLTGNGLANLLTGGTGSDTLDGAGGIDTLIGGRGNDIYIVGAGDVVVENFNEGHADEVRSSASSYVLGDNVENLFGVAATGQSLTGNALGNFIRGGTGNDIVAGGEGSDSLQGGLGDDVYITDQFDFIQELAGQGTDEVRTAFYTFTLAENFENLTGLSAESQTLRGNSVANVIRGGASHDLIDGGGGVDTMHGGLGDDYYIVEQSGDNVVEAAGAGLDRVESRISSYTLSANVEELTGNLSTNQTLIGNGLNNLIQANLGNDTLDGGVGADTLEGRGGNDIYIVDNAGDVVIEEAFAGSDRVRSSVTHILSTNVEHLDLVATANINGTGNDLTNQITGNAGNNVLDGGGGTDLLFGGDGNDTYVLETSGDKATETSATGGTDTVRAAFNYTLTDYVENLTLIGTAAITGTGNALVNLIIGNDGHNRLDGGAGADTLRGGIGNDTYVIDASDTVDETTGGGGVDTVIAPFNYTLAANLENLTLTGAAVTGTGNALNNILIGNANANSLSGLDGNDMLDGGAGADTLTGGTGHDIYIVDHAGDNVVEASGAGQDQVRSSISLTLAANVEILVLTGTGAIDGTGNGLSNQLLGNGAANILDGGAGLDFMYGGDGNDTYIVDALGERATEVSATGGTDTVLSSVSYGLQTKVENLTLTGTASINAKGNELANVLIGNSGNNYLIGFAGADNMTGGLGNDVYEVDNGGDVVTELAGQGTDTVQSSITLTLGANLENLTLTGSAAINGTGNALNNVITGNNGANSLGGLDGDDTLIGGAGADTLTGGLGNDVYHADASDTLVEGAAGGTDRVQIGSNYSLLANFENLVLTGSANINGTGNSADNQISGNSGNNVIDGGAGIDLMFGGDGNDTYIVDNAGDRANEGSDTGGTDTVQASVTFTLGNRVENLTLTGSSNINGNGNAAANVIIGNSGNNVLFGGLGADTLNGGSGNDTYLYRSTAESTSAAQDTITGFGAGDRINLAAIDADTDTAATNEAFTFVGANAFSNTAGELRAVDNGSGSWTIEADVDGDGNADLVIGVTTADPAYLIGAGDFVV